jgi:hypothetical protein
MKYVVSWTYRLNGSAAENEASIRRANEVYERWMPTTSMTYHAFVGRVDGAGGFAVLETDNPIDLAVESSKFGFWVDYQLYPVVDITESARAMQEGIEFRESIS